MQPQPQHPHSHQQEQHQYRRQKEQEQTIAAADDAQSAHEQNRRQRRLNLLQQQQQKENPFSSNNADAAITNKNIKRQRLQRRIEELTADLAPEHTARLSRQSDLNATTICDYIQAMKTEINPSRHYKLITIQLLYYVSEFHNQKPFADMVRDDIVAYLDSLRKTENEDQQHRYVGTYNLRRIMLSRFFKWVHDPNVSQDLRPTPPAVMQNIPKLRRKEITTIKPSDLWTEEDHAIFLKYCDNKRDRAYHAIAMDSSCRPSEILRLRIKDLNFLTTADGQKQYAQITVNGKTGTRNIPLFSAVPYVKNWLDDHPMPRNPEAYLIPTLDKRRYDARGSAMQSSASMNEVYNHKYRQKFFPGKLADQMVPAEDKLRIRELLKKPFNPYIQRHSALTQKAQKLTTPILKQHAGWSLGSRMELKYLHLNGAESNDAILSEIYGLETAATLKSKKLSQATAPKVCPQCNESNIPDCKFCRKCRMVLTFDAYEETIAEQKQKDSIIEQMRKDQLDFQERYRKEREEARKEFEEFKTMAKELLDTRIKVIENMAQNHANVTEEDIRIERGYARKSAITYEESKQAHDEGDTERSDRLKKESIQAYRDMDDHMQKRILSKNIHTER